jgi:hypothetical protein
MVLVFKVKDDAWMWIIHKTNKKEDQIKDICRIHMHVY